MLYPKGIDILCLFHLKAVWLSSIYVWKPCIGNNERWCVLMRIIGSSISLLQRLWGKILRVCKDIYKHTLWKVCYEEQYGSHSLYSTAVLHKVNVSNYSFEDFLSLFPTSRKRTSPPYWMAVWHSGRWKHRAWGLPCAPSRSQGPVPFPSLGHGPAWLCLYQIFVYLHLSF